MTTTITEDEATRQSLVHSRSWREATADLPIMAVADAGPINMAGWSNETHSAVRCWARGWTIEMPAVLREYLARCRP